jgi:mannose/fructose/N-acetylgalactosamine-specific phosphotransferase system component IIC
MLRKRWLLLVGGIITALGASALLWIGTEEEMVPAVLLGFVFLCLSWLSFFWWLDEKPYFQDQDE